MRRMNVTVGLLNLLDATRIYKLYQICRDVGNFHGGCDAAERWA